jgi:hypothetical protein
MNYDRFATTIGANRIQDLSETGNNENIGYKEEIIYRTENTGAIDSVASGSFSVNLKPGYRCIVKVEPIDSATETKSMVEYINIKGKKFGEETRGNIVFHPHFRRSLEPVHSEEEIPTRLSEDQNNEMVNIQLLKMENIRLEKLVADLETETYNLQTEKRVLKLRLLEYNVMMQELSKKGERLMEIYNQTPLKILFCSTFLSLLLSLLLFMTNYIKLGAITGFLALTLLFFSIYSLWRLNNVALIRPKLMVLCFFASLGLFLTGIISLFEH